MNAAASAVDGCAKKRSHGRVIGQLTGAHEQDLVGEAPCLAEIVSRHHDLGAARMDLVDDALDLARCAGIEVRRRLVEEQHFRRQRPRARERELLLLAAGQYARRAVARRDRARRRRACRARAGRAPRGQRRRARARK